MNNLNRLPLLSFAAIYLPHAGIATASDQSHAEAMVPHQNTFTPTHTNNATAVFHSAATGGEFVLEIPTTPTPQSPHYTVSPVTMASRVDTFSPQAVNTYHGSGLPLSPSSYTGEGNDESKFAGEINMSPVMDRDTGTREQTGHKHVADAGRHPYAVVALLIALLGMVSVARRNY